MTDIDCKIIEANQAAEKMLKIQRDQMVDRHFVKIFVADPEQSAIIEKPEDFGPKVVKLNVGQQLPLTIKLSSRILLDYSRRVFFLEDLTELEQRTRLETLSSGLYDIAVQTRLPLSLGMSILRKLQLATDPNTVGVINKSLNQLSKAERAFERIALYGQTGEQISENFRPIALKGFFEDVFDGFSLEERNTIDILQNLEVLPGIFGDHYQLEFVFRTILDYLLRFNPPAGRIQIETESEYDSNFILFHVSGIVDENSTEAMEVPSTDPALQARAEVSLAENFLRRFIERNHRGVYQKAKSDNQLIFTIRLPQSL